MKPGTDWRVAMLCVTATAGAAWGQCSSVGPDAAVSDVNGVTAYGSSGGVAAFSVGATICNRGDTPLPYGVSSGGKPLIASGVYRLSTVNGATRLEQIGLGWVFSTFSPLSSNSCCGTCAGGTSSTVGAHCSSPETASIMGTTSQLSPRYGVNAATGAVNNPSPIPAPSGALSRRLQAAILDIDAAQNPGALWYVELQTVTAIETGVNRQNNSSYRRCSFPGVGQDFSMALQGITAMDRPVIYAWQDADAAVVVMRVGVPGDGDVYVGARATPLAGGLWRYEYAVQNVTSDRSVAGVSLSAPPDVSLSNAGFHHVNYHSGDGAGGVTVSGAAWPYERLCDKADWQTTPYAQDVNANAIRWGTLYNFRFDADSPPGSAGSVVLGLYKPGPGDSVIAVTGLPTPRARWDSDGDGQRTPADVAVFVNQWFANLTGGGLDADFDQNGAVQPADIAGFLNNWFSPPGC